MPQKRKPARLWLRPDTGTWFIRDGKTRISTECAESETAKANEALAAYIADQYQPKRGGRADQVTIADVLLVYLDEKAGATSRPKETKAAITRLNDFMGDKAVSEIRGKLCREFVDKRGTESGARRDLEVLRSAINYYHGEHQLDVVPKVTLPQKSLPRERSLTRSEFASLVRAARKAKVNRHIVRLLFIGVYTGTRLSAILGLQWMPNTTGGWIDLERGVIHRKAMGERVAHNKRKTAVKIAPRLLRLLKAWKREDTGQNEDGLPVCLRYVVHFGGEKIIKPHKAFRTVRKLAGLGEDVTPHVLRHTRATWLSQAGGDAEQAAASLGLTAEEFERTYSHANPDFQKDAANAF